MSFSKIAALPDGPSRVAALAAWVQPLFPRDESRPILVGRRLAQHSGVAESLDRLDRFLAAYRDAEPTQVDLEAWSRTALEEGE